MTVILLAMLLTAQSTPSAFALPSPERRNTTTKWDFNDPQHRESSSTNANKAGVSLVRTTPRHFTHPTCNNNPPSFDCDTSKLETSLILDSNAILDSKCSSKLQLVSQVS